MTSKPTIQIGDEVREMTDAEYEQWLADVAQAEADQIARNKAAKEQAKAKQAVLEKLGLTADEVAALLA
jgi:primosomal protein N''